MEVMEEMEEMVLELKSCQYGEVKSGSATRGPDCVVLSRNNTTDGLSRFWVAHTLTFIIQSNELGFSIIPAINCLARSQAKFK